MNKWLIAVTCLAANGAFAQTPAQKTANGAAPDQTSGQTSAADSFKQRDANKDGFLSKTEINGSRVADRFDQLDADKDGKLSLAEYQAGRNGMSGGNMRSAEDTFKERDTDKDGYISKSEMSSSRMADRFDQIDANKDGKLSLDELKAARQNMGGAPNRQKNGA